MYLGQWPPQVERLCPLQNKVRESSEVQIYKCLRLSSATWTCYTLAGFLVVCDSDSAAVSGFWTRECHSLMEKKVPKPVTDLHTPLDHADNGLTLLDHILLVALNSSLIKRECSITHSLLPSNFTNRKRMSGGIP